MVLTGATDWVSDGNTVVRLSNGHPYLADITGSGCMVGTCVAIFCAATSMEKSTTRTADAPEDGLLVRGDMFAAAIGGYVSEAYSLHLLLRADARCRVLALTVASEYAGKRKDVKGSGTFLPALIDELGKLTFEKIMEAAKVEVMPFSPS